MFRFLRLLQKKPSKQIKTDFPTRKDSIKNLENKDYNKITNDFKTYGSFVNFCISKTISVKTTQRRAILNTFFEKQNKNIKDK